MTDNVVVSKKVLQDAVFSLSECGYTTKHIRDRADAAAIAMCDALEAKPVGPADQSARIAELEAKLAASEAALRQKDHGKDVK